MTRLRLTVTLLTLSLGCVLAAQETATAPADEAVPPAEASTQPASRPTTQPATRPTTSPAGDVDPEAMEILRKLEAAGKEHEAIRAELTYEVVDRLTGDSEVREGEVFFRARTEESPEKFRISFRTLQQAGGPRILERVDYAFDGHWLTVARHRTKQMTRYQVVPEGETAQPLKLGKGPFPVPFGQQADDVVEHFHVSTRELREDEPEDTDYIELVTREKYAEQIAFEWLRMWVSHENHLPVKLVSRDKSERMTTVTFENTRTDAELGDDIFRLPRPLGWQYRIERLENAEEPQIP
ncbi:MAG: LolA family protein [Phycisphaerae bacterium]